MAKTNESPCPQCGTEMTSETPERHAYDERMLGLPGVVLTGGGVTVRTCPACGERETEVERMGALHETIARAVATKAGGLVGADIRFLRGLLDVKSKELAALLGVAPETLSRWETDTYPISQMAERLLRLMVLRQLGVKGEEYSLEQLRDATTGEDRTPLALRLRHTPRGWKVEEPRAASTKREKRAAAPARKQG